MLNRDRTPYHSDFRGVLKAATEKLKKKEGLVANAAPEIEGFLVDGINSEQMFDPETGFSLISSGGYYHSPAARQTARVHRPLRRRAKGDGL